jgi:GH15 family glucan-1,4-alpha-glucosidase
MNGYPSIGDYALIGDCHTAALVSRTASIDWCCMPRFDSGAVFGRLLDWERAGHCSIEPLAERCHASREYLDGTLGAGPCPDRGGSGGPDHVAAGGHRLRPELGLSL